MLLPNSQWTFYQVVLYQAEIVQMPRGNLEVIHPRSLTLKIVVRLLETGENYGEAMEILRRQRINQNIVVDNNPALFIANVRKFLQQVLLHCQLSKKKNAIFFLEIRK